MSLVVCFVCVGRNAAASGRDRGALQITVPYCERLWRVFRDLFTSREGNLGPGFPFPAGLCPRCLFWRDICEPCECAFVFSLSGPPRVWTKTGRLQKLLCSGMHALGSAAGGTAVVDGDFGKGVREHWPEPIGIRESMKPDGLPSAVVDVFFSLFFLMLVVVLLSFFSFRCSIPCWLGAGGSRTPELVAG